jgi:hypothetical protein
MRGTQAEARRSKPPLYTFQTPGGDGHPDTRTTVRRSPLSPQLTATRFRHARGTVIVTGFSPARTYRPILRQYGNAGSRCFASCRTRAEATATRPSTTRSPGGAECRWETADSQDTAGGAADEAGRPVAAARAAVTTAAMIASRIAPTVSTPRAALSFRPTDTRPDQAQCAAQLGGHSPTRSRCSGAGGSSDKPGLALSLAEQPSSAS